MQIAKKYAQLLFNEASKTKILGVVGDEIASLNAAIFLRPEVTKSLSSPVTRNKSEILLEKVMEKYKVSSLTTNFVKILVRLKRLRSLPSIAQEYSRLLDSADGSKLVDVVFSSDASSADRKAIEKLLEARFGGKASVKYAVDPTIIGGVLVKYDSIVIDASVKGAMERMLV
jgi:F-type H+-transporting ATPase subunit delta